jgi:hypothetical protein
MDELAELRALLDHYRGRCDVCGRENVLLDQEIDGVYEDKYLVRYCWVDPDECARVAEQRRWPDRQKHREAALRGWATRRQRAAGS